MRSERPPASLVERVDLYRDHAELYDRIYFDQTYYWRGVRFLAERLVGVTAPRVLDLCAGTGSHAVFFLEAGFRVVGVDRSPEMLAIARLKAPGARFVLSDIRELRVRGRFHAVVCLYGAIHYLETPADIQRVLATARDRLLPGGLVVLELRDRARLSSVPVARRGDGLSVHTAWLPAAGAQGSDLYVVSTYEEETGRHFVDVHHLFLTDPARIAEWAAEAGFADVRLHAGYTEIPYGPGVGGDAPVLVARRL